MTSYRIVCTEQEPICESPRQAHIVAVGTGPDPANARWELAEVLTAMNAGDSFYTMSPSTGKKAEVRPYKCPYCTRTHIKSAPDAVTDNNLDDLRYCKFSQN
jgi:hypothetical protein